MRNYKITKEEKNILKRYLRTGRGEVVLDYLIEYSSKVLKDENELWDIDEQMFYFADFYLPHGVKLDGTVPWTTVDGRERKSQVFDKNIITVLEKLKASTENEEIINYTEIMIEVIKIIQKYNFVEKDINHKWWKK